MTDRNRVSDLEGRSDEDLVEEYSRLKAELVYREFEKAEAGRRPGEIVEDELIRRGVMPDREDLIPDTEIAGEEHPVEAPPDPD